MPLAGPPRARKVCIDRCGHYQDKIFKEDQQDHTGARAGQPLAFKGREGSTPSSIQTEGGANPLSDSKGEGVGGRPVSVSTGAGQCVASWGGKDKGASLLHPAVCHGKSIARAPLRAAHEGGSCSDA